MAGTRVEAAEDLLHQPPRGDPLEGKEPVEHDRSEPQVPSEVAAFTGIEVAVRAGYPETSAGTPWEKLVQAYRDVGAVEVAFHRGQPFLSQVSLRDVVEPLKRNGIRASSISMAHARVSEPEAFLAVPKKTLRIAEALDSTIIVVHPSYGRLSEAEPFMTREVASLLARAGVILCWEAFSGSRRFLTGIEGIAAFCASHPWHRACYDTSHLHRPQAGVLEDIRKHAALVRCGVAPLWWTVYRMTPTLSA